VNAAPVREATMTGLVVCLAVLAGASLFGLWHRRREGRMRMREKDGARRLTEAEIGAPLGERATLVQFSSAFCAPCRATRGVLGEVAGMVDGVVHVEIDAESHLDLVRELAVLKTPTVFVLDGTGAISRRATGLPRKADVIAAIGSAVT
jgi:thiol-disulfide isomerase/thioredoxin